MDDKAKKRAEMIKKYNKNISDEELGKKLNQMEFPEEYEKEVRSKERKYKQKFQSRERINKLIIKIVKILKILGWVIFFVGLILRVFTPIPKWIIVPVLFILMGLAYYWYIRKVGTYILQKLGIKSRLMKNSELAIGFGSNVQYPGGRYHLSEGDIFLIELIDENMSKSILGLFVLIILFILYFAGVLLIGFILWIL